VLTVPPDKIENAITTKIAYTEFPTNIIGYKTMIDEMVKLAKSRNGVGLSSIQIGIPFRLFVAYDFDNFVWKAFFNASYCPLGNSKTFAAMEGCLTYPTNQNYTLTRYDSVYVEWDELTAEDVLAHRVKRFFGKTAQVLQHEIDHCDGKTVKMIGKLMV